MGEFVVLQKAEKMNGTGNQKRTGNRLDNNPEELLHYECEQAFLRRHYEAPVAEEEWKAFLCRVQGGGTGRRTVRRGSRSRVSSRFRYVLYGTLSVAAVWIACLLWLPDGLREKDDTLTLYVATGTELPVMVEEQPEESGPASRTVIAENESKVVKKGVVYSSKEADYTGQAAERARTSVVSIPCGRMYKIVLHDRTEVWLNADSRLIFPSRFTGTKRVVRLEGEAYFKVTRNEQMPFIIETGQVTTQVLGTEFNIKTYKDADTHVTLVDGSVKVTMPAIGKEVTLEPGEDVAYAGDDFHVKKVDTAYYTQWRDGYFYFDDMHLADILSDLGRWYNVTIEMEKDSLLMNQKLHFVADRSEEIDQVIRNLAAFEYLSVSKKENKLTVRRKK